MKSKMFLPAAAVLVVAGIAAVVFAKYDEWFVYPVLRARVSATMKDPDSTQFRNEKLTAKGWLCGEVNAKNGFGAYEGFKRFAVWSADEPYIEGVPLNEKKEESSVTALDDPLHRGAALLAVSKGLKDGSLKIASEAEWQIMLEKLTFEERWKASCS